MLNVLYIFPGLMNGNRLSRRYPIIRI